MSYTHKYLPELDILKQILSDNPNQITHYVKYESLIGPIESVNYLNKQINEYHNSKS